MVSSAKSTGRARSMPAGIGIGTLAALGWTVLGAAVTAFLVMKEVISQSAIGYGAMITLLIGGWITAKISYGCIKHRRVLVMGIAGTVYFLCLMAVNALFFGGQYAGVGVSFGVIAAGSGTALLLGNENGSRKRKHKYKIRR